MQYNCSSGAAQYICLLPTTSLVHWIAEPFIPRNGTSQIVLPPSIKPYFVRGNGNLRVEHLCENPFISRLTVQPSVSQSVTIICEDFDTKENSRLEYNIPGKL